MGFFLEVVIGGLLSGVLYSLVALGFVLIFKASRVLNFAQGAMVLFAGLALVRSLDYLKTVVPLPLAIIGAFVFATIVMAIVAWLVQRFVLSKLINQSDMSLLMATIGIASVMEGVGLMIFGSNTYRLDVGLPRDSLFLFENIFPGGLLVSSLDIWGGVLAAGLVIGLTLFFQYTRTGLALRGVADDHAAAQSIGVPISRIWFIVWAIAGIVALVASTIWGSKVGVQFSMVFLAMKALPVLIFGGFTSIPGVIVGGLLIGAGEKLAEIYLGPAVGGGVEYWFAYVFALFFLLIRPHGLFGDKHIERI